MRTKLDMEPTLVKELIEIDDASAQSVLQQIKLLSLPLFVQHGLLIDGTGYEFSNLNVTLSWNDSVSREWSNLAQFTQNYVQLVDELAQQQNYDESQLPQTE
jgi:hypothetical protein